jgi:hypothetical protein
MQDHKDREWSIDCAQKPKDVTPDTGSSGTVRMSLTGTSFRIFSISSR